MHVISRTRLPLFSLACIEKIREPGNEATLDVQCTKCIIVKFNDELCSDVDSVDYMVKWFTVI